MKRFNVLQLEYQEYVDHVQRALRDKTNGWPVALLVGEDYAWPADELQRLHDSIVKKRISLSTGLVKILYLVKHRLVQLFNENEDIRKEAFERRKDLLSVSEKLNQLDAALSEGWLRSSP